MARFKVIHDVDLHTLNLYGYEYRCNLKIVVHIFYEKFVDGANFSLSHVWMNSNSIFTLDLRTLDEWNEYQTLTLSLFLVSVILVIGFLSQLSVFVMSLLLIIFFCVCFSF